ncbi:hypothetical protein CDAR_251821 [Caerostris darwini]|uniref:Uncharacterized protein n=1 Tax=Caerostris darwini TaxID=1538125 RepID=A0AAV4U2L4_9ARAC|nr:hypothetical protein CDAR_251821 [Caerostris darwini]
MANQETATGNSAQTFEMHVHNFRWNWTEGRDTYNGRIRSSYGSKPLDPALASPVGVRCHIALRPQYWIEIRLNKLFAGGKVDAR